MMVPHKKGLVLHALYALLLWAGAVCADYIEGLDTTDVDGYGLDSSFSVNNNTISGKNIVRYGTNGDASGYYDYTFDEIKMAPDSNRTKNPSTGLHCCVIKSSKDNTYSKIQVLSRLPDGRYVFKFGKNTTPNDRMLEKSNYDLSLRYKPNNLSNIFSYYDETGTKYSERNISTWDPPLPSNHVLRGYIFYRVKQGISIDTTAAINLAQWDSIAFLSSTDYTFYGQPTGYYNIVAVYNDGKSDFLKGWTNRTSLYVGVKPKFMEEGNAGPALFVRKANKGFLISLQSFQNSDFLQSLFIYNAKGEKVAGFPQLKNNHVLWKPSCQGLYIARLELQGNQSISKTFFISLNY